MPFRTAVAGPDGGRLFWLYLDVPELGIETGIAFEGGRLTGIKTRKHDIPTRLGVIDEWARDLVAEASARAEREQAVSRLTERAA